MKRHNVLASSRRWRLMRIGIALVVNAAFIESLAFPEGNLHLERLSLFANAEEGTPLRPDAIVIRRDTALASPAPSQGDGPAPVSDAEPVTVSTPVAGALPPAQEAAVHTPSAATVALASKGRTVYGDLSHPDFTATANLRAELLSPEREAASPASAARFVVGTVNGAGVELRVNGAIVPMTQIGSRSVDARTGETRFEYYGVPLQGGPNRIELTPLGAQGLRGPSVTETVYGPGRPVRLAAALDAPLQADGKTSRLIHVRAMDAWNHPAAPGGTVRVWIASGDAKLVDGRTALTPAPEETPAVAGARPATQPGMEVALGPGGAVDVPILPGLRPGPVELRVSAGGVDDEETFDVVPTQRAPLVNGLVTVGTGSVPGSVDGSEAYDAGGSRRSRAALYASGSIARNASATLAYESANRLAPTSAVGSYEANGGERPYETSGDASSQRSDTRSRDHLFARVDSGRNSVLWGEFQAQTGGLAAYSQVLSGAKLELGSANRARSLTVFTARNAVASAHRTFSPTGLASLGVALDPDVVVGSEQIALVTLDRRTGGVIATQALVRDVDYVLDYGTGTLRFVTIPLPFDAHLNPQAVDVSYQYAGAAVRARTTGGRAELAFGPKGAIRFGVGFVNDATGSGNYAALGEELSGKIPGGSWSLAHASTQSSLASGPAGTIVPLGISRGEAFHAAFDHTSSTTHVRAELGTTSEGFSNPFGGVSTPGLTSYRASLTRTLSHGSELTLGFDGAADRGLGRVSAQHAASVALREVLSDRATLTLGLETHAQSATSGAAAVPGGGGTQGRIGIDYRAAKGVGISVARTANFAGSAAQAAPAQTTTQMTFDFGKAGKAYLRQLWSDAPAASLASATAGLTASAAATHSTAIGFDRALSPATSVDSQYVIDNGPSGSSVYSSLGVREKFAFGPRLRGDGFVQRANAAGSSRGGFGVAGLSLAYADAGRLRANVSFQQRTGDSAGATYAASASGPLSSELTLLGSLNVTHAGSLSSTDARIGLALRPSENDRRMTLVEIRRRAGNASTLGERAEVISIEHIERIRTRTELSARAAQKIDGDAFYAAHTALLDVRAQQRIGSRVDVALEQKVQGARGIPGARSEDAAFETGYRIGDQLRVAAGYNLSASADPSLVGHPLRQGLYATFTSVIDRLFGWGKTR